MEKNITGIMQAYNRKAVSTTSNTNILLVYKSNRIKEHILHIRTLHEMKKKKLDLKTFLRKTKKQYYVHIFTSK